MGAMAPLLTSLLAAVRPGTHIDDCLVCHGAVRPDEARMRLPGGGYVHQSCSTYRMRQDQRIRQKIRSRR